MIALGIDLIEVDRIRRSIQSAHFCERVFGAQERQQLAARSMAAESAAACFALLFVSGMHKSGAEPETGLPAEGGTPESDPAQTEGTPGGEDDDARLAEELRKAYNSRESFVENGAGAASPEKASEEKPGGEENQR